MEAWEPHRRQSQNASQLEADWPKVRLALGSWPISTAFTSSNDGAFDVALSDQDLCRATVLVSFCHLDTS